MPTISKTLRREHSRKHYLANRDVMIAKAKASKPITRDACHRFIMTHLLDHPCVDCGEADPIVLEFDHRGDKVFNISEAAAMGLGLRRIRAEIAKCDVRCANCHRRKTYAERGFTHRDHAPSASGENLLL